MSTRELTIRFGGHTAVDRVSLDVAPGSLVSIIGPNGAGKTTFFNLLSGQYRPTSGRVHFKGEDVTRLGAAARTARGIGRSFQLTNVFPTLSVLENVRVAVQGWTQSFNFWSRADRLADVSDRAHALLKTVGLSAKAALVAAHLSHGEKRHLEIGITLASNPELLLLDEPTAGMSPEETDETMRLIRELTAGRTVILVEHKMKLVMRISDRITVLHQGQVIADGSPAEIRANERVQQTYLGAVR